MIVKEEFLSRLRKIFDLNLYEVKVWTALLSRGTSTAGELSSISDVPRSRTYDILESLEKKGFIIMKLGKLEGKTKPLQSFGHDDTQCGNFCYDCNHERRHQQKNGSVDDEF